MTDMTEQRDVDTVIDGAIRDAATARDMVTTVEVEDPAAMVGVSVWTIRHWIQHAHPPHMEDETGRRGLAGRLASRKEGAPRSIQNPPRASTRMLSPRSGTQRSISAAPVCQCKSSLFDRVG